MERTVMAVHGTSRGFKAYNAPLVMAKLKLIVCNAPSQILCAKNDPLHHHNYLPHFTLTAENLNEPQSIRETTMKTMTTIKQSTTQLSSSLWTLLPESQQEKLSGGAPKINGGGSGGNGSGSSIIITILDLI